MIVKSVSILRFGGLRNLQLEFSDGCNLIYGENEVGKSTLQAFFKAMLYGFSNRKENDKWERKKALPWEGGLIEGSMTVELDGRLLEIRRRMGVTAKEDEAVVVNPVTGEIMREFNAGNIGERLLGISQPIFEKTVWIRQNGTFMGGRENELTARLMNLAQSGEENVSADSALKKLTAAKRKLRAPDRRSAPGILDTLEQRQRNLQEELKQSEQAEQARIQSERELERVEQELERLESNERFRQLQSISQRGRRLKEYARQLDELRHSSEYYTLEKITEEQNVAIEKAYAQYIQALEHDKTETERNIEAEAIQKKFGIRKITALFFMLLGMIGGISSVFFGIYMLFSLILIAFGAFLWFNNKENRKKYENNLENDFAHALSEKNEQAEHLRVLTECLAKFGFQDMESYRSAYTAHLRAVDKARTLYETCQDILQGERAADILRRAELAEKELQNLDRYSLNVIGNDTDQYKRRQELQRRKVMLENAVQYEFCTAHSSQEVRDMQVQCRKEQDVAERELYALTLAEECLKQAAEKMRDSLGSLLNEQAGNVLGRITAGKYNRLLIGEDYRVKLSCADGRLQEAEYFSAGTYEQVYFALRMGLAQLLCGGSPVFLDECFRLYDDTRTELAVRYLSELPERTQVFLFTCQRREVSVAQKENIRIICLKKTSV